jgi:hypothetical protein
MHDFLRMREDSEEGAKEYVLRQGDGGSWGDE